MQNLLATSFWVGVGSRILAAAAATGMTAIFLFAVGGMPVAHQGLASAVGTMKGNRHHRRLLLFLSNWSSQFPISFSLMPLPPCGPLKEIFSSFHQIHRYIH